MKRDKQQLVTGSAVGFDSARELVGRLLTPTEIDYVAGGTGTEVDVTTCNGDGHSQGGGSFTQHGGQYGQGGGSYNMNCVP